MIVFNSRIKVNTGRTLIYAFSLEAYRLLCIASIKKVLPVDNYMARFIIQAYYKYYWKFIV